MLTSEQIQQCESGLALLARPVLPLARLAGMLFLTGPFQTMAEVSDQLPAQVETASLVYDDPQAILTPFLAALAPLERLKHPQPPARLILSSEGEGVDPMEAIDGWLAQNILSQELETINSLLCGPCQCRLCCIGPQPDMRQQFFEIPLREEERALFSLPETDTDASRQTSSAAEPPLLIDSIPFYQTTEPRLIHWQNGWRLLLPRATTCPQLDGKQGSCTIYPQRPDVCRRPQIFPYALERSPSHDMEHDNVLLPAYIKRDALLAIWDCPYVQQFQDEIGSYAQLCELEPIFKENKS